MAILLGYESALNYWRSCAQVRDKRLHRSLIGTSGERKAHTLALRSSLRERDSFNEGQRYLADNPESHLLICDRFSTRHPSGKMHRLTFLPPRSCVLTAGQHETAHLYVSTPEFCFLQMASVLDLHELIALGYELCGTYARQDDGARYDACPLTSPMKIGALLAKAKGTDGIACARRALRYVVPNSASPMETNLTMLLCLPHSLGGYGLDFPELNCRIDIPAYIKKRGSRTYCVCDLYWKDAKLAIEYDSDLAHAGIYKTVQDAMRRSVLTGLGVYVLSVTNSQVKDMRSFDQLAHLVAKRTRKRLRFRDPDFASRHRTLRASILASSK